MTASTAEPWVPASDGGAPPRLRAPLVALAGWWAVTRDDRAWWVGASVLAVGLAVALGTHPPAAPTLFWHLANGDAIRGLVLPAHAPALVGGRHPFDARSWLADLALARLAPRVGPGGLTALGAAGTVLLVGLVAAAARAAAAPARLHPVAMLAGVAAALASMPTTLAGRESLLLPVFTAALVGLLAVARRTDRPRARRVTAARASVPVLLALWANTQSDVVVGVGAVWLTVAAVRLAARGPARAQHRLPLWLPLAALLAPLANPTGPHLYAEVPLSLGGLGVHGVLTGWASPDLQTWGRRWAELTALALAGAAALRPRRSHPADGALAVAATVLALFFSHDLAVFAVVAGVWLAAQASSLGTGPAAAAIARPARSRRLTAAALVPAVAGCVLAGSAAAAAAGAGGPGVQAARGLPVATANWLLRARPPGPWLTTVDVGSYLAARLPEGHRLLCLGDPVPLAGRGLRRCGQLAAVAPDTPLLLRRLHLRLAVLPGDAGLTSLLRSRGWRVVERGGAVVVLAPPAA